VYTTAFDASGKEDDPNTKYVVVAGFVSAEKIWNEFDVTWRHRLATDGLSRFHMRDWRHRVGVFNDRDHWTRSRCDELMDDLLNILIKHVSYKFACVVRLASYTEHLSEQRRREFLINAYVLAARGVVQRANEWSLLRDRQPVEHVFEDGDEGKGLLMRRLKIEGLPRPRFRWAVDRPHEKTGIMIPGFTPLQGADIYAYETLRFAQKWAERGNVKSDVLRELDQIQGEPLAFSAEDLAQLSQWIERSGSDPTFWERHRSL
jgi:hypothetical protein